MTVLNTHTDSSLVLPSKTVITALSNVLCIKDGVLYQLDVEHPGAIPYEWVKVPSAEEAVKKYGCDKFRDD